MAKPVKKKKSLGRSSFSAFVSLGLLSIPVKGYRAVSDKSTEKIGLNMICPDDVTVDKNRKDVVVGKCHKKLSQTYNCPVHGPIERERIVKGYEGSPGIWTLIEPEFLEKITPESSKNIIITKFYDQEHLDAMLIDVPYFLVPEPEGAQAYNLMCAALDTTGTFAFGKAIITGKERVVVLVCQEGGIVLWTLNHPSLIKDSAPFFEDVDTEVEKPMLDVMKKLIAAKMSDEFDEEDFVDHYEEALLKGIQARVAGKEFTPKVVIEPKKGDPNDLMASLMGSFGSDEKF
jgi:DNA end-binding protein Ku